MTDSGEDARARTDDGLVSAANMPDWDEGSILYGDAASFSGFTDLTPPYATIVVDPPWGYAERTAPWRSTSTQSYSLMSLDEIRALPVAGIATEDAHLYLWSVLPLIADAVDVVRAWGFSIETVLTWCKPGPGLGAGFRGNTEHLLVARRGFSPYLNPACTTCGGQVRGAEKCRCEGQRSWRHRGKVLDGQPRRAFSTTAEGTWYVASRGAHSAKPALFADLIERMSPGPYVELFSREPRLGWDSWGLGYELGRNKASNNDTPALVGGPVDSAVSGRDAR